MISPLQPEHSAGIVRLHIDALKGDFLPSLGIDFLTAFYNGVINLDGVYGFIYEEKGKVMGFVLGTKDSGKFFSQALRSNFIELSLLLLLQVIKNPKIIKNVFETLFYPKKESGPKAELVIIAVDKKFQVKGVGRKLIKSLETTFKNSGISRYKLTVHADKTAVAFYEHLGYSSISNFRLYDKMWFVYEKEIS